MSRIHETRPHDEPNLDILRNLGWNIQNAKGIYCSAWRGTDNVLFVWRSGKWERVMGENARAA